MKQRFFLIRHAQADTGPEHRILGNTDLPLGVEGLRQAGRLAQRFKGMSPEGVWASDLKRSQQTAQAIADVCGVPLFTHPGLREMDFGRWEGIPTRTLLETEEFARWARNPVKFPPPGGESLSDLKRRMISTWEEISRNTEGERIIVGHGGGLRVLLSWLLGIPLENSHSIAQDHTGVSIITLEPRLLSLNDTCHLG